MPITSLIVDLALIVFAASVAGALAHRLGQPALLGYLLAGAVIGPHALGVVSKIELVNVLAEVGVAFLMFALGVHVSLRELQPVRRVAVFGGTLQILLTMALGVAIGQAIGLAAGASLFLGAVIALSSTSVTLKVLADRGELDALHGRITTGLLIVQDLSVVPIVVLLSALVAPPEVLAAALGLALVKAGGVLAGVYVLGTRIVPAILLRVAELRSRELFLLAIVALVLGTAIGASALGISFAFGAFIAGVVVSESEFSSEILAEVVPLRDLFSVVFFASIGMLVDGQFILANVGSLGAVIGGIVLGKLIASVLAIGLFGYATRLAILAGLGLVQIGEFSFVLARIGVAQGILDEHFYSLTTSAALVTILLTPVAMQAGPRVVAMLAQVPLLRTLLREPAAASIPAARSELSGHVVIAGYGAVGRLLGQVLTARRFRYFVIDYDPHVIAQLRKQGIPCVYGDAGNPHVLALANLPRCRVFAVTLPDPLAAERAIRNALQINPRLDAIARAPRHVDVEILRDSGATEVVEPKFETGLEIMRHALHRFGVSSTEIAYQVSHLRERHYRGAVPEPEED
ncbi:MAG: cation:proton antiporter [Chloroflexi bacterium]|nr:cation:proton antiporter [Chloroflexota bacterium]